MNRINKIKSIIEVIISNYLENCVAAAFVGSEAIKNINKNYLTSDLDVLAIWHDIKIIPKITKEISIALRKNLDTDFCIVNGWGVVSSQYLRNETIHLLFESSWYYFFRSSLFRRSVSKYQSFIGQKLKKFAPRNPISLEELILDKDGPVNLLQKLEKQDFQIEKWEKEGKYWALKKKENTFSDLLDQALYVVLHSARNVLRFLNKYEEFSDTNLIITNWKQIDGPAIGNLTKIVKTKDKRMLNKKNNNSEINDIYVRSKQFLSILVDWIQRL